MNQKVKNHSFLHYSREKNLIVIQKKLLQFVDLWSVIHKVMIPCCSFLTTITTLKEVWLTKKYFVSLNWDLPFVSLLKINYLRKTQNWFKNNPLEMTLLNMQIQNRIQNWDISQYVLHTRIFSLNRRIFYKKTKREKSMSTTNL